MEIHEFDKMDLLTYATGGSSEQEARRIRTHLLACPSCRQYIETFGSENSSFLASRPFEEIAGSTTETRRAAAFRPWRIYALAASLALAVTTGYFFLLQGPSQVSRIKGAVGLELYVKNAQGEIEKRDQQVYTTGERIQFRYSCAGRNKFILLSIDTAGAITTYYPSQGDSSEVLEPGQDIPLPHSILLDDYNGKELFLGVFSEKRLAAPYVRERLRADFNRVNGIDSIGLFMKNVSIWKQSVSVIKGKPQ
jgi:hypothetical protein